ncbi:MAG: hypothetical protein EOP06_20305 [Proteobacteria bacterium]|nr:MAG: hypothetical protein EOP06_20305 [Pseudomonadota bacterium]
MQFSFLYILTDAMRTFLYIGATSDLTSDLVEHTAVAAASFSRDARPVHLIYFENFRNISQAGSRAEELRRLRDSKRWKIIMNANPCLTPLLHLDDVKTRTHD